MLPVRGHRHRVHRAIVPGEGAYFPAALQIPHLQRLVTRGGNGPLAIWGHRHRLHPAAVPGEGAHFPAALQIPHLQRLVRRGGNGMLAVWGHRHRVHPATVPGEGAHFPAALQIPHLQRLVIRGGNGLLAVRGHRHRVHHVTVPGEGAYFPAALQIPHLQRLVTRGGNDSLAVRGDRHRAHRAAVPGESAEERSAGHGKRRGEEAQPRLRLRGQDLLAEGGRRRLRAGQEAAIELRGNLRRVAGEHVRREAKGVTRQAHVIAGGEPGIVVHQAGHVGGAQAGADPLVVKEQRAQTLLPAGGVEVVGEVLEEVAIVRPGCPAIGAMGGVALQQAPVEGDHVTMLLGQVVAQHVVQAEALLLRIEAKERLLLQPQDCSLGPHRTDVPEGGGGGNGDPGVLGEDGQRQALPARLRVETIQAYPDRDAHGMPARRFVAAVESGGTQFRVRPVEVGQRAGEGVAAGKARPELRVRQVEEERPVPKPAGKGMEGRRVGRRLGQAAGEHLGRLVRLHLIYRQRLLGAAPCHVELPGCDQAATV